jgi:hypothetical protein
MSYPLKTKILISLSIILGLFVFSNLFLISNTFAGNNINNPNANSSDQFPHAGNVVLDGTTGFAAGTVSVPNIIGVDNGSLTIGINNASQPKTLQFNGYNIFVINPGFQIINQKGYIAKSGTTGNQIVHGYLWAKDVDGDGCFATSTVRYNQSSTIPDTVAWGTGYRRVKDLTYAGEPDDGSAGVPPGCVAATFDFSLSLNPVSLNISRSSFGSTAITASLSSGTTQAVNFSVSGLPAGVTPNVLTSCSPSPTCSTTLTLTASASATLGLANVTITATSGSVVQNITLPLTVCQCSGTSGCCDGCNYRPTSYVCDTVNTYSCSSTACSGNVMKRSASKYCSGTSVGCDGTTGSYGSATLYDDCTSSEKCDSSATCRYDPSCVCSCAAWANGACDWTNGCRNQTRTCTPSNCSSIWQCVSDSSCTCTNDGGCTSSGIKMCSGDYYRTCGNYDSDPCLEWSTSVSCGGCGAKNTGGCTNNRYPYWGCKGAGTCYVVTCGQYGC